MLPERIGQRSTYLLRYRDFGRLQPPLRVKSEDTPNKRKQASWIGRLGLALLLKLKDREIDGGRFFLNPGKPEERADLTGVLPDIRLLP